MFYNLGACSRLWIATKVVHIHLLVQKRAGLYDLYHCKRVDKKKCTLGEVNLFINSPPAVHHATAAYGLEAKYAKK